jgi:NHL repeat
MNGWLAGLLLALVAAGGLLGEEPVKFTAGPKAISEKDSVKIEFAVNRDTDVAVEILDEKGNTVRHLVAGVLGENAPEPLEKDSLKQSLLWDRKDDLGRPVPAGAYSVRIGLGLAPLLKKLENFHPLQFGAAAGVASMPKGGVCIFGRGPYSDFLTRLVTVDRDGAYVRQLYPPPANVKPEESPGIPGFRRGDGRWVPMLKGIMHNLGRGQWSSPMCRRGGTIYVSPFGAAGIWPVDVRTGAVAKALGGKSLGMGKGKVSVRALAAGGDGKWLYFTGIEAHPKKRNVAKALHAVYRAPASGGDAAPFVGDPAKSGKAEALLNAPAGLAVDSKGNLYVCDNGNDRVAVFSPDGKFVRQIAAKAPLFVRVHPKDGRVFAVLGGKPAGAARSFALAGARVVELDLDGKVKVGGELKVSRRMKRASVTGMALDSSKSPAVLWVSVAGELYPTSGGVLFRFECREAGPAALDPISTNYTKRQGKGPYDPRYQYNWGGSYMNWNEAYDWKYLTDEGTPFCSKVPLSRKPDLWPDGKAYKWSCRSNWYKIKDWKSDIGLLRMSADGKPLAFEALGSNALKLFYKPRSPWFAQRGIMVDRRGHVYMRYSWDNPEAKEKGLDYRNQWATGILHFDDTGKLAGKIVLTHGTYGMGTDVRGNIYVGDKPRPAGVMVPADIEKAFGGKVPESISKWYGSVIKFGPKGGGFLFEKGKPKETEARRPGDLFKPPMKNMDADIGPWLKGGRQAKVEGAEWVWVGMSPMITTRKCICYGTDLAVDAHGRVYAPDKMACRVAVLDPAGNLIRYIGSYGNMDSRGKGSPVPEPEIAFCLVRMVTSATSRQVRVADNGNSWVSVINLGYAVEKKLPVSVSR